MIRSLFILFLFAFLNATAQRNNVWCFGDSAQIKFGGLGPIPDGYCSLYSQEECAAISDNAGNLLFYTGTNFFSNNSPYLAKIWNKNHQVMQNGDSLLGDGSATNGNMILPKVSDPLKYFVFSLQPGPLFSGLYCSIVDMSLNSGLGAVILRDSLIIDGVLSEKMCAVKHANGYDWWILIHDINFSDSSNVFYRILFDSSGINSLDSQIIGSYYGNSANYYPGFVGEMTFSEDGSKLVAVGYSIIDLFDFNRCTGELSNWKPLSPVNPAYPIDFFYGCSISPDGTRLYVSNVTDQPSRLYQFDLLAANIIASKQILYASGVPDIYWGQHQIGPNNKIYIASGYYSFPIMIDTVFNQNVSVINNPDSLGSSCGLQLFNIPIGQGRSTGGLPNFPNYNLGTLEVNCDSINKVSENIISEKLISILPNPSSGNLSLIFTGSKASMYSLKIFSFLGKEIINITGRSIIGRNFCSVDLSGFEGGIYFAHLMMDNKQQTGKIILY